jgi:hypothetical protein
MPISEGMASCESGHIGAESTLCGVQPHEKNKV